MCEKFTVWCQKGAFAGGRGAVSTKKEQSWAKGALGARRTPLLAGEGGAVSAYKDAIVGEKGRY